MSGDDDTHGGSCGPHPSGTAPAGGGHPVTEGDELADAVLEEELRQAAAVFDPVPPPLLQLAVDAFALHDLDARVAELVFDSLEDAAAVRGGAEVPRMLTFTAGEVTVDVEVTDDGLIGQVLPPQPARIEVLGGPRTAMPLTADDMGRFTGDVRPAGPFALRLHAAGDTVVTPWLRI